MRLPSRPSPYAAARAASTTSTRRTIPAPPPYGESSTWPPPSGVVSLHRRAGQELDQLAHQMAVLVAIYLRARRLDALGAQEARHGARRTGAVGEPVPCALRVDHDRRGVCLGVVVPDRLDRPAV